MLVSRVFVVSCCYLVSRSLCWWCVHLHLALFLKCGSLCVCSLPGIVVGKYTVCVCVCVCLNFQYVLCVKS